MGISFISEWCDTEKNRFWCNSISNIKCAWAHLLFFDWIQCDSNSFAIDINISRHCQELISEFVHDKCRRCSVTSWKIKELIPTKLAMHFLGRSFARAMANSLKIHAKATFINNWCVCFRFYYCCAWLLGLADAKASYRQYGENQNVQCRLRQTNIYCLIRSIP